MKRAGYAAIIAAGALAAAVPARAADPQGGAKEMISSMGNAVIGLLARGADRATREQQFRALYRANFDNAGIAAMTLGPTLRQATPPQRQQLLAAFEDYVVRVYSAKLANYSGEKLLVLGSETEGGGVVVTSQLVDPDPRAARNTEIKWHLASVGGRLKVRDVVIDKISMVMTQRREFSQMAQQSGGNIDTLIAALRQRAGEADSPPVRTNPGAAPSPTR